MKGPSSKLIHGNIEETQQDKFRSLKTPIYDCASFDFESSEDLEDAFAGRNDAHAYSRVSNPTVAALESKLSLFAGAEKCVCVSSGMAAISSVVVSLCNAGDNIITSSYLFGNTYGLFKNTLSTLGIEVRFVDMEKLEEIERNIDSKTRAIFMEILTNPQLVIYNVDAISEIATKHNLILIADNSVLTPYVFQAKKFKIDVEVFSTTKFISGGATSVGGAILVYDTDKWKHNPKQNKTIEKFGAEKHKRKIFKEMHRNFGACLSPNNAYLQLLGLETLQLRIDRISKNAKLVAEFLKKNEKVKSVEYCALPESAYHQAANTYLNGLGGSLVALELESKEACFTFMDALKMIRRGTNFCDNKSMIIHPSSTILNEFSAEEKLDMSVSEGLIRLSVGLENVEDIIEDITQALESI